MVAKALVLLSGVVIEMRIGRLAGNSTRLGAGAHHRC